MKKKTLYRISPVLAVCLLLLLWQAVCMLQLVPAYMLPSPVAVVKAFCADFSLLMYHLGISLGEAFLGLGLAVILSFLLAVLMERFELMYHSLYPLLVITQTVPVVAIAPLLVLWLGYGILPKVVLILLVAFFPIAVGLLDGFRTADEEAVLLLRTMGASHWQILFCLRLPAALPHFFSGLRIAVAYSVVGAVIAEWLGGFGGLGVYMTRVKSSYAFDKMFAVIFLITGISLFLLWCVKKTERFLMPWQKREEKQK